MWHRKIRIGVNCEGALKQRDIEQTSVQKKLDFYNVIKIDTSDTSQLFFPGCVNII